MTEQELPAQPAAENKGAARTKVSSPVPPAWIESFMALILFALVAYTCWVLYGNQISSMIKEMFAH